MSGSTIIVADDDPIIRMDVTEILESDGYRVVAEAKNGDEAAQSAYKLKPDLVVMDIKMPVMNGIKAASLIRKICDAAILLLTAYSQKELVLDARTAGVTSYLVKPVSEHDLLPAVQLALQQRETIAGLKQEIKLLEQSLEERKKVERVKGIIMTRLSLNEDEAYRWMRRQSMDRRISLCSFAEQVLRSDFTEISVKKA